MDLENPTDYNPELETGENVKAEFEDDPGSDINITNSADFKEVLLKEGRSGIKKAEEWLEKVEMEGEYDPKTLKDRQQELERAKRFWQER